MKTIEIVPGKGTALSTNGTLGFSHAVLFIHKMFAVSGKELGEVPLLQLLLHCYQQCFMLPTTYEFLLLSYECNFTSHVPVMGCLFIAHFILQGLFLLLKCCHLVVLYSIMCPSYRYRFQMIHSPPIVWLLVSL